MGLQNTLAIIVRLIFSSDSNVFTISTCLYEFPSFLYEYRRLTGDMSEMVSGMEEAVVMFENNIWKND